MARPTDALGRVFPARENEFRPRAPMLDEGPSPGLTGIDGMVLNQATLWGQSGQILISEKMYRTEDLGGAWGTFDAYYGSWVFQLPKWLNTTALSWRRYMTFIVDADLGISPTITMTAVTSLGNTVGVRTSYNGRWVTLFKVPIPGPAPLPNDATWFTITLKAVWSGSGSGTFFVGGVYGFIERVVGTLDGSANSSGVIDIVDNTQLAYQQPVDVHSMRALHATNEVLFASNMRPVVCMGWWPGGTDEPADATPTSWPIELLDDRTDSEANPYWEWVYFPRQGAGRLRLWLGAVKGSATNRDIYIAFKGHEEQQIIKTISTGSTSNDPAFWQIDGDEYLDIPPDKGPFFLRVGLVPSNATNKSVILMKFFAHEEILKGGNLT
jgi:hypothetical protein